MIIGHKKQFIIGSSERLEKRIHIVHTSSPYSCEYDTLRCFSAPQIVILYTWLSILFVERLYILIQIKFCCSAQVLWR